MKPEQFIREQGLDKAREVVPLKDGKELKMLQGIYGSAMFNPASTEEVAAGHRIDNDLGDDFPIENRISPLCKSKDV